MAAPKGELKPCYCDKGRTDGKMEAVQFNAESKAVAMNTIDAPEAQDGEVLIQVAFAGICGTDLKIIDGEFPCTTEGDFTLGHEFSGTVKGVGEGVAGFEEGDRVVVDPSYQCNSCEFCHKGQPQYCLTGGLNNYNGMFRDGGWAHFVVVPASQVYKLPDAVSLEQGVFCEPLSCLMHMWDVIAPVVVGQKILVLGAGIVGTLVCCMLHAQGHRDVTVTEDNDDRKKNLEKLGLGFTVMSGCEMKSLGKGEDGPLFDLVIDSSGSPEAMQDAVPLLNNGAMMCIFGAAPEKAKLTLSPYEVFCKELRIHGAIVNPTSFHRAVQMANILAENYLDYCKLGVKTFELKDYEAALAEVKGGGVSKGVFKL